MTVESRLNTSAAKTEDQIAKHLHLDAATAVLLAAIRGETTLDDEALDLLMLAEPDAAARKRLVVGLKAHRLITAEQCALMFFCFSLDGE